MNRIHAALSMAAAITMSSIVTGDLAAQTAYEKLVAMAREEMSRTGGLLRLSTDWTDGDARPVIEQFMKDYPFILRIDYKRETGSEPFVRYFKEIQEGRFPPYNIMHIGSEFQPEYLKAGIFVKPPFNHDDVNASLPAGWPRMTGGAIDPQGYFVATTANSRGIAYNPNLVKGDDVPKLWADCVLPKWKGKVLVDGNNKFQAFQHDGTTRAQFVKLFDDMLKNEVVVVRGQELLVNKIASGEFPMGCGVNYQTVYRAIETQGVKTLAFTFGESIPLEISTRIFVTKWSTTPAVTQLFGIWAATAGQLPIGKYAWRGFPWNEWSHSYEASKGKYIALCESDCAAKSPGYDQEFMSALRIATTN